MNIRFKKVNDKAVTPFRKHQWDAGVDLTAISVEYDEEDDVLVYDTGIAVEIPPGYVGLIAPRSSIASMDLTLSNSLGIIDADYRGTIKAKFRVNSQYDAADIKDPEFQDALNNGKFMIFDYTDVNDPDNLEKREYWELAGIYKPGDRVCQLIIVPIPPTTYIEVEELSKTERGEGGYGSTGLN